jgi:two-component system chemotaxis sensor kinase CheA
VDSNDLERDVLLRVFSEQADEGFAEMAEAFIALEADPGNGEVLNSIFRVCHTLNGDAASLGFPDLAESAHVLEELLACLREGVTLPSREVVSLLLQGIDALRELVDDALQGREGKRPHHEALLQELGKTAARSRRRPARRVM